MTYIGDLLCAGAQRRSEIVGFADEAVFTARRESAR